MAGGPSVDGGVVTWRVPLNGRKSTTIQLTFTVYQCPQDNVFNLSSRLYLVSATALPGAAVEVPNKQVGRTGLGSMHVFLPLP